MFESALKSNAQYLLEHNQSLDPFLSEDVIEGTSLASAITLHSLLSWSAADESIIHLLNNNPCVNI